jgi:hypothetical protein
LSMLLNWVGLGVVCDKSSKAILVNPKADNPFSVVY